MAIERLGDVICKFLDVFFPNPTRIRFLLSDAFREFGSGRQSTCHLRPHRSSSIVAKEMDTIFNQYLAAGLVQLSISPYSSPLVFIPKTSGGVRITVNYKKLNDSSRPSQLLNLRLNHALDSLRIGRVFSLFDLAPSFHQITAHQDMVPLTAFNTPAGLYKWPIMPQGNRQSPSWFVTIVNEVAKSLEQGAACTSTM